MRASIVSVQLGGGGEIKTIGGGIRVPWTLFLVICEPILKFFVALFTTFGMQKDDHIIFVCRCFRTK